MADVKVSRAQMGCIKALFKKLNTADADAVVLGFSPASGGHVSNMLVPEGIALIRHLKSLDPDEKAAEVMRRKMIALAHELQWQKEGTKKVDMVKLDGWCKKFGMYKKSLNQHTIKELPLLISQFEIMYKKDLSKV